MAGSLISYWDGPILEQWKCWEPSFMLCINQKSPGESQQDMSSDTREHEYTTFQLRDYSRLRRRKKAKEN